MPNQDESDFWAGLTLGQPSITSSLDTYLQEREEEHLSRGMRVLTDAGREAAALPVPAKSGLRVSFLTNIGSVLSYPDPPDPDSGGTVVMVRTAEGDQTGMGDMVFVKWDDGKFMAMHREHLRKAKSNKKLASNFVRTALSLGDLTGFFHASQEDNDLVHKATKDLWSFTKSPDGAFVISRLFDETGDPLKV